MGIRSRADRDTDSFCRIHRWRATCRVGAVLLNELFASEIHRVLHGPAHAERLHALETFLRCIVEVRDRPSQRGNGNLPVEFLEQGKQFVDGRIAGPVHG